MALSTTGVQAMLERLEIGELVFNLKEVHHKCAPSWNRRRIARKFDGWQLTLPGTLLFSGENIMNCPRAIWYSRYIEGELLSNEPVPVFTQKT
jgi:hypothetical protein